MAGKINDDTPKITIGITSFNAVSTVARALQSALDQDWPSFEIVIVDDCSTDGTWEIIQEFARAYPHVRTSRNSVNRGAAESRNAILRLATGQFVAFFDDDDVSTTDRLTEQFSAIVFEEAANTSTDVVCYASAVRRYPNGYELFMPAIGSRGVAPFGEEIADYLLYNARKHGLFYGAGTPTCALMTRVSTLQAIGGFDSTLRRVEDVDMAIRLALRGSHFVGTKKLLVVQYATVSADKSALKNFQSESLLVEKYAPYLRTKRSYNYAKRWFYIRYLHFDHRKVLFTINIGMFFMRYPIRSLKHFANSVPKRWLHERRIRKSRDLAE